VGSLIAAAEGAAAGLSTISGGGGAIMPFTGSSVAIAAALGIGSQISAAEGHSGPFDIHAGAIPPLPEIFINFDLGL
jgi:hypothetical protein